jgi:hypothetical protein
MSQDEEKEKDVILPGHSALLRSNHLPCLKRQFNRQLIGW